MDIPSENIDTCPICFKTVKAEEIESHVNKCLFLNSTDDCIEPKQKKRKNNSSLEVKNENVKGQNDQKDDEATSRKSSSNYSIASIPLAENIRPNKISQFVGQEHAVGQGTVLRKLLDQANIPNLIFWGPPGCGKTTLANLIKETLIERTKENCSFNFRFVKMHATQTGVNDIKEIINAAKNEYRLAKKKSFIFMDEIHRFNKAQQDTFLPHIENGTVTLIGATTENPSFSLNNALLSRCRVITLEKLSSDDIVKILIRAVEFCGGNFVSTDPENRPLKNNSWTINQETIQWLADISDGDARIALNSLQMAIDSKNADCLEIILDDIKDSIKKSHLLYDKNGEEHYNMISALHKSIRASDDNASIYWMTRMLMGGEDPIYIARRLVRIASEDIGLAEPNALILADSTMRACQQIGMPECDVLLAHLVTYLSRCPKSREVYDALKKTKEFISKIKGPQPTVPLHLRNAPTKLMKDLGYSKDYNMKHKNVSGLTYMPDGFEDVSFFDVSK